MQRKGELLDLRMKVMLGVGGLGLLLLGILAYNLGGANQETADVVVLRTQRTLIQNLKRDIETCNQVVAGTGEEGDDDSKKLSWVESSLETAKKNLEAVVDQDNLESERKLRCAERLEGEQQDRNIRESATNYEASIEKIQSEISITEQMIKSIEEGKSRNRTTLKEAIRAMRLENASIRRHLKKMDRKAKEDEENAEKIKRESEAAHNEKGIGQKQDGSDDGKFEGHKSNIINRLSAANAKVTDPEALVRREEESEEEVQRPGGRRGEPPGEAKKEADEAAKRKRRMEKKKREEEEAAAEEERKKEERRAKKKAREDAAAAKEKEEQKRRRKKKQREDEEAEEEEPPKKRKGRGRGGRGRGGN